MISFYERPVNYFFVIIALCVFESCDVYDDSLIETDTENVVIQIPKSGTGGESGSSANGASGVGGAGINGAGISGAGIGGNGNGGTGIGGYSGSGYGDTLGDAEDTDSGIDNDSGIDSGDDVQECGNGRVSDTETCDIGILADMPGACPTECPEPEPCVQWVLEGVDCQTQCVKQVPGCEDGDDCCPSDCNSLTDSDCSASCGDGTVQAEEGEICEPDWALEGETLAEEMVCPTECPDDGDPCTEEELLGNPDNCNAECTQTIITSLLAGDLCCPKDANANTDDDCEPICGNGVREAEEECDGSDNCDDQCRSIMSDDQARCEGFDIHKDACEQCTCANCVRQALACFDSEDSNRNALCIDVVACAHESGCVGPVCYCGSALNPLTGTCLIGTPDGPCKEVIEQAAGTTEIVDIFFQQGDANSAVGRVATFSTCYETNCLDICQ